MQFPTNSTYVLTQYPILQLKWGFSFKISKLHSTPLHGLEGKGTIKLLHNVIKIMSNYYKTPIFQRGITYC